MRRLVIAIDCDDVLMATTPYFVDAYNAKYGTSVKIETSHIDGEEVWGVDREVQFQRLDELTKTAEYFNITPTAEEVAVLNELSESHSLHLVTARKPEELELTQTILNRDLPGIFTSFDFVGWTGSKGEVCERIGAHVLIDDSVRNLVDAFQHGMPIEGLVLFGDYLWNQEIPDFLTGVKRCPNWNEVRTAIDAITNA
jgi:5'(3')-deoxyribonucleotidase